LRFGTLGLRRGGRILGYYEGMRNEGMRNEGMRNERMRNERMRE
jgi:hypothetical protein